MTRYEVDLAALPGHKVEVSDGVQSGHGVCTFEESGGTSEPGTPRVVIIVETGYDPATCRQEVAVAEYPLDAIPPEVASTYLEGVDYRALTGSGLAGSRTDAMVPSAIYWGALDVRYKDPPGIVVTQTMAQVQWSATNSCVNAATPVHDWGWYTTSGWTRTGYTQPHSQTCSQAVVNTTGTFRNAEFCSTTTYTNHSKTRVVGMPGGAFDWSRTISKSGGCTVLLHSETIAIEP